MDFNGVASCSGGYVGVVFAMLSFGSCCIYVYDPRMIRDLESCSKVGPLQVGFSHIRNGVSMRREHLEEAKVEVFHPPIDRIATSNNTWT